MSSLLPTPEPPDPVEGQLGHFDHSNWVKASLKALDAGTMRKDGDVSVTGDLIVDRASSGDATVRLQGSSTRSTVGTNASAVARWRLVLGDSTAESGSNGGSLFKLLAYADDGSLRHTVLSADRGTGLLTVVANPTAALGIATKSYVDTGDALSVAKVGDTMTGALTLPGNPASALQAAPKQYVDTGDAAKLDKTGGTLSGFLTLHANPTAVLHAAPKQYVDSGDAAKLNKAGDSMTGFLTLHANPTSALHAVTKQYADGHSHTPQQAGIRGGQINFNTLVAGEEKTSATFARATNERIFVTLIHVSSRIAYHADEPTSTTWTCEVRNESAGTTYTDVRVNWIAVAL